MKWCLYTRTAGEEKDRRREGRCWYRAVAVILAVFTVIACPSPTNSTKERSGHDILSFRFPAALNDALDSDVNAEINELEITLTLPFGTDRTALIAQFTTNAVGVFREADIPQEQESGVTENDFTEPLEYRVTAGDGTSAIYTVRVRYHAITDTIPASGSMTAQGSADLNWEAIGEDFLYEVQIATSEEGVASAEVIRVNTNTLTPENPPEGSVWYWRVRALRDALEGDASPVTDWSEISVLHLNWEQNMSDPVILQGPDTGVSTANTTPVLSWLEHPGAEAYEMQLVQDDEDGLISVEPVRLEGLSREFDEPLDNNSTFWWRVRAVATDAVTGNAIYSPYSLTRSFAVAWGTEGPEGGIRFASELALLNTPALLGGSYTLANDIDLSGYEKWTPIGSNSDPFTGTFDGQGFTITGLTIDSSQSGVGFFGRVSGATIRNVRLQDVSVRGRGSVGALIGNASIFPKNADITVENCHVTGSVSGNSSTHTGVGGLIGTATDSSSDRKDATVSILNSSSDCSVVNEHRNTGGLLGVFHLPSYHGVQLFVHLTVSGSFATGDVIGRHSGGLTPVSSTGGLIGRVSYERGSQVSISGSGASGNVTVLEGGSSVGGFIGSIGGPGISGAADVLMITDSFASGNVNAPNSRTVGGFIGSSGGEISPIRIENCRAHGDVHGQATVGGFIGSSGGAHITTPSASRFWHSVIISCYATGDVSGNGGDIGGFVGYHAPSFTDRPTETVIQDSYARGNVSGGGAGGFAGSASADIFRSYSTGRVDGTSSAGGFASGRGVAAKVEGCFYDRETSGQMDNTGRGTPQYTTNMKDNQIYRDAGWDFVGESQNGTEGIWNRATTVNDGYPYLEAVTLR